MPFVRSLRRVRWKTPDLQYEDAADVIVLHLQALLKPFSQGRHSIVVVVAAFANGNWGNGAISGTSRGRNKGEGCRKPRSSNHGEVLAFVEVIELGTRFVRIAKVGVG